MRPYSAARLPAANAALAERRIAHRLNCGARGFGIGDMRHLDALHAHVKQPQDEGRVETRGAHDRGDADPLSRHDHRLHIVQIEAGMLHVDKGGVKPGNANDLDDLWVGNSADMSAQGKAALPQDALYPISCIVTFLVAR